MTRLQKVLFAGPDDRGQKTDDHAKRRGRQKNQRVAAIFLKTETSFLTGLSGIFYLIAQIIINNNWLLASGL